MDTSRLELMKGSEKPFMKLTPEEKHRVSGELVRLGTLEPNAPEGTDIFGNAERDLSEQGSQETRRPLGIVPWSV